MSEETKVIATDEQVDAIVARIKELSAARKNVERRQSEVENHSADLVEVEKIYGVDSPKYSNVKDFLEIAESALATAEKEVERLSFKRSELRLALDTAIKNFNDSLRAEQEREYHIQLGECEKDKDGKDITPSAGGRKVYKQICEYVNKDVEWTPGTAPGLMVLSKNLEANQAWVRSGLFDGTIIIRSAEVLVLWTSLTQNLKGRGYYTAKDFLTMWTSCGKALSDAVGEIEKNRKGTHKCNEIMRLIETEFELSENDLPDEVTTKDEVAPEV